MHSIVMDYIKANENQVTEYQLLKYIDTNYPSFFDGCADEPSLYRKHFRLFNLLYKIDQQLVLSGQQLDITPLHIRLIDCSQEGNAVGGLDELRKFYLDKSNFDLSETEINQMLSNFWERYLATNDLSNHLKKLEIASDVTVSLALIKRQYNQLAFRHHPDQGGNAERFAQITDAYQQLKKVYGPEN